MLPGGTDAGYRALLGGPYHPRSRVEVWREGVQVAEDIEFFDGNVSATLTSQVTRQLQFTISEEHWPLEPDDLFAPYGNEIRAFVGIDNGAGIPYEWQVFRGRINEVTLLADGSMSVFCLDRAADVNDSGFTLPENSTFLALVTDEFRRLVIEGVPDATFGTFDNIIMRVPVLTWESDRGSACDDLATASGAYWYALANGDYVIRFIPWTVAQTSLITLRDGDGGSIISAEPSLSRENVFNVVTVVGERADGSAPTFAFASDENPDSPTYINGPFGRKSKLVQAQAATNQGQAASLARSLLKQAKALTQSWSVTISPDPSLELGDAVTIQARGLPEALQVVSGFMLPLSGASPMSVALRSVQPGALEE